MMTAATIIAAPNAKMPRILTSLVSWCTAGLSCDACSVMSVRIEGPVPHAIENAAERLVELRIVQRQNRAAAELPDETAGPDQEQCCRQQHVEPAHGQPF